jgi:hypothetical protein
MQRPFVTRHSITSAGSIFDEAGLQVYLSTEEFIELIKDENRCFLCGISRSQAEFNNEHVIPNWVQRACGLARKSIQLPNNTSFPYPLYKIPCCVDCNSFLADFLEQPISLAFLGGEENFSKFFNSPEIWKIFLWMNLIYFKIHIKDNYLRLNRDLRTEATKIGDIYPWEELHHCHALVRAQRFGVDVDIESVLGSTMSLHLGDWAEEHPFDYNDHFESKTVMIRIKRIAVICVLNDSCGTLQGLSTIFELLPPDLSPPQFSELLSEFQFISLHLKHRPQYRTRLSEKTGKFLIDGIIPPIFDLSDLDFTVRGALMLRNLEAFAPNFSLNGLDRDQTVSLVKAGDVSFIRGGPGVAETSNADQKL